MMTGHKLASDRLFLAVWRGGGGATELLVTGTTELTAAATTATVTVVAAAIWTGHCLIVLN